MKIKLLPEETTNTLLYHAISTITFYQGNSDPIYLRSRVREIVAANPWVAGRLVPGMTGVQLEYQKNPTSEYFDLVNAATSGVSSTSSYDQIHDYVKKHVSKTDTGIRCLVYGKQLFQVSLIRLSSGFAVYFSLSHVIGDGYSFYKLYKMLDPKVSVVALDCNRFYNFKHELGKIVGKSDAGFFNSVAVRAAAVRNIATSKPKTAIYKLDKEKLSKLKLEKRGDQKFVSSNDVVTSFYFETIKTDYMHMLVNCRGRIEGVTSNLADNISPADIRKSVVDLSKPHKSHLHHFAGASSVSLITSWTGLYHHLEFENAELKCHIPLVDQRPLADGHGILFNYDKDTLCLFVDSSDEVIAKFDEAIATLGNKI